MNQDATTLPSPVCLSGVRRREAARSAGALIVAIAAVAFSTAGLFTRLIAVAVWTMLFWRGVFGGLLIAAWIVWQERSATLSAFARMGRTGVLTATCSTVGTICFISALRATTVADVAVIYATAPFIAACIAWAWTGERPRRGTLVASALAEAGVAVMCGVALPAGHVLGDALALAMTVLMALMMVVIRKNRAVSMLPAACLSAFACAVVVLPLAHPLDVTASEMVLLALFGTTQFGLGLLLLTIGSRLISATRASLLVNLELPFAPLWVWLAFGEVPSQATAIGGGIVCVAVVLDLVADRALPWLSVGGRWQKVMWVRSVLIKVSIDGGEPPFNDAEINLPRQVAKVFKPRTRRCRAPEYVGQIVNAPPLTQDVEARSHQAGREDFIDQCPGLHEGDIGETGTVCSNDEFGVTKCRNLIGLTEPAGDNRLDIVPDQQCDQGILIDDRTSRRILTGDVQTAMRQPVRLANLVRHTIEQRIGER